MRSALLFAALLNGICGSAMAQSLINTGFNYGGANTFLTNPVTTNTSGNFDPNNPTQTGYVLTSTWGQAMQTGAGVNPYSSGSASGYTSSIDGSWAVINNNSTSFTGPSGNNLKYARYDVGSSTAASGLRLTVGDNVAGNSGLANSVSVSLAQYVTKANFLNGFASSANLTLQSLSLSVNVSNLSTNGASNAFALVENGTQWYVSAVNLTSVGTLSIANLSAQTWYAWNPSTYLFNTLAPGTGVSGSTFGDVEAIGVLAQTVDANMAVDVNGVVAIWDEFNSLQVTATAVPEPSSVLLGGMGAGIFLIAFLRRRAGCSIR